MVPTLAQKSQILGTLFSLSLQKLMQDRQSWSSWKLHNFWNKAYLEEHSINFYILFQIINVTGLKGIAIL